MVRAALGLTARTPLPICAHPDRHLDPRRGHAATESAGEPHLDCVSEIDSVRARIALAALTASPADNRSTTPNHVTHNPSR